MKSLAAAGLLVMAAAPASGAVDAPATYECTETAVNIVHASFGPKGPQRREKTEVQRYTVDPARKTVTMAYSWEEERRIAKPVTLNNAVLTYRGRVVFCTRTDGKCDQDVKLTQSKRTLSFKTGLTILNTATGTVKSSSTFNVNGIDGSWYGDNGWVNGPCRKV